MTSRSDLETDRGGIRAIFATTASTSATPIVFLRLDGGSRRWDAPASSITSMALSGSSRSLMYRSARLTAASRAWRVNRTWWCSSNRDFNPLRMRPVSSSEGSLTSII